MSNENSKPALSIDANNYEFLFDNTINTREIYDQVVDVDSKDYPPVLDIFEKGNYHIYDYQFFFRNLQNNVTKRVKNYFLSQ